jgi:hypothetical protein
VKAQTFHFEIKDLVTQFVAAFDDIIIKRYDKNRVPQTNIQVRYVYSPKQRVIYDLVNKAQNITVPVVAVNITNVSRDESRVFNKLAGFYLTRGSSEIDAGKTSNFYRTPVPVNITISMSIITKFQTDMDQIISNFVPYNNPYIILSWRVPDDVLPGYGTSQEIRSEVLWDGNINLNYPIEITALDKYRITGDTTFTIKGWLFQATQGGTGNIFYIDNNFYATSILTTYETLTSLNYTYPLSTGLVTETEFVGISANPQITNVQYN